MTVSVYITDMMLRRGASARAESNTRVPAGIDPGADSENPPYTHTRTRMQFSSISTHYECAVHCHWHWQWPAHTLPVPVALAHGGDLDSESNFQVSPPGVHRNVTHKECCTSTIRVLVHVMGCYPATHSHSQTTSRSITTCSTCSGRLIA